MTPSRFKIEIAALRDVPAVAVMSYKLQEELGQPMTEESKNALLRNILKAVSIPTMKVLLLTTEKHHKRRVVGMAVMQFRGKEVFGSDLYIDPHYRGSDGIIQIFTYGEKLAREAGIETLVVDTNRLPVGHLFEKNGFVQSRVIYSKSLKEVKANE